MTSLRPDVWRMPSAAMGPENPLAPLHPYRTVSIAESGDRPRADYPDRGNEAAVLPYRLQDNYGRRKSSRDFKTAVLENEFLRATFLLEFGGRLWSLFDKQAGRELLHVNPVFQPANLAVRDAWFSGGVEWNVSIIGHCPFTCSPVFAARVEGAGGYPILRIFEYERIRGVPFQVDFHLPPGSRQLFVRPRIDNPRLHSIPMYWWSNIAVEQTAAMRVIAPADSAYYHDYDRTLKHQSLPFRGERDVTYPDRHKAAADLYFQIPPDQQPWIVAADANGQGIFHASTRRLAGRKMFVWGMAAGGRRWQEHLSRPGQSYIEIQGGLAPTQTEYVAMPAGERWEWVEAFGAFHGDAIGINDANWAAARGYAKSVVEKALADVDLEALLHAWQADADRPPVEVFQEGSGWGALEQDRQETPCESGSAKTPPIFSPSTLGAEQARWRRLLESGEFPHHPPTQAPGAYMTDPTWRELLERSIAGGKSNHWLAYLHLGVMRYRAGEFPGAKDAWEKSIALEPSAWAVRNLAVLAMDANDPSLSAALWRQAHQALPTLAPLAVEACEALLRAGNHAEMLETIAAMPPAVSDNARVKFLGATAGLRQGDFRLVEAFFASAPEIFNIREGELSLSDLWFEWHESAAARRLEAPIDGTLRERVRQEHPLPREFDFRMTIEG